MAFNETEAKNGENPESSLTAEDLMVAKRLSTTHRNVLKLSKAEKYHHGSEYIDLNNWLD